MEKKIKYLVFKFVNFCFSAFPIKRNRVFFCSFYGKSYSDNPKAISKALFEKYGNDFEHVWVLNQPSDDIPHYIHTCKHNSLKMLYYMSTSKVWVSNFLMPKGTYKRKGQYYIQTWHGDRGFKKILRGVPGKYDYIYESEHADLITAGSEFGVKHYYREGFGFQGEIAMTGCPRNDIFFKDTYKLQTQIREHYSLAAGDKVVMYAPTFREKYKREQQELTLDLEKVRATLEAATSDRWVVLVRSHITNAKHGMSVSYNDRIKSVTDYPDMNELLQITDILISDYSSSIGDFSLSGKLCLLYQDDFEEYTCHDRSLIFDMDQSPFYHFSTPDETYLFLSYIKDINPKTNSEAIDRFYGTFDDGHASETIADVIAEKCYKK